MKLAKVRRGVQVARWGLSLSLALGLVGLVGDLLTMRSSTGAVVFQLMYLTHPPTFWLVLFDVGMLLWLISLLLFIVSVLTAKRTARLPDAESR